MANAAVVIMFTPLLLPPYYTLPHIFCLSAPWFLSFSLIFFRTVLYNIFFGLSKERRLSPSFYYIAIPFFALCLPALIHLSLPLVQCQTAKVDKKY